MTEDDAWPMPCCDPRCDNECRCIARAIEDLEDMALEWAERGKP